MNNTLFANKPTSVIIGSSLTTFIAANAVFSLIKEGMLSHAAFIATQVGALALSVLSFSALLTALTLCGLIKRGFLPQLDTPKAFYKAFALSVIPITGLVIGGLKISLATLALPIAVMVIAKIVLSLGLMVLSGLIIYGLVNCSMPDSQYQKRQRLLEQARPYDTINLN